MASVWLVKSLILLHQSTERVMAGDVFVIKGASIISRLVVSQDAGIRWFAGQWRPGIRGLNCVLQQVFFFFPWLDLLHIEIHSLKGLLKQCLYALWNSAEDIGFSFFVLVLETLRFVLISLSTPKANNWHTSTYRYDGRETSKKCVFTCKSCDWWGLTGGLEGWGSSQEVFFVPVVAL